MGQPGGWPRASDVNLERHVHAGTRRASEGRVWTGETGSGAPRIVRPPQLDRRAGLARHTYDEVDDTRAFEAVTVLESEQDSPPVDESAALDVCTIILVACPSTGQQYCCEGRGVAESVPRNHRRDRPLTVSTPGRTVHQSANPPVVPETDATARPRPGCACARPLGTPP